MMSVLLKWLIARVGQRSGTMTLARMIMIVIATGAAADRHHPAVDGTLGWLRPLPLLLQERAIIVVLVERAADSATRKTTSVSTWPRCEPLRIRAGQSTPGRAPDGVKS